MGKKSPAPPPDYTQEKKDIREKTEAKYEGQAKDYNQSIADLTGRLDTLEDQLAGGSTFASNLNIGNLYDDAGTYDSIVVGGRGDPNEQTVNRYEYGKDYFDDLGDSFADIMDDYSALVKPTFESSVGSEYGPIGISVIPELSKFQTERFDRLQGEYDDTLEALLGLEGQREAEETRIEDFRKNINKGINSLTRDAADLTIADLADIKGAQTDLGDLLDEREGFSSTLLDQLYPDGFSNFDTKATELDTLLSGLRTDRDTELQRISDFESGLYDLSDAQRDLLEGYDITNKAEAEAVLKAIDDRVRDANRFESVLDFDFSQELEDLGLTRKEANQILIDRAAEEGRITDAQAAALKASTALSDEAEDASIYSLAGLDAIGDQISDAQTGISGFTSLLPFDFADASTNLETALENLEGRRDARATALDDILAATTEGISGIDDLADYDEEGMRAIADAIAEQNLALADFTGGRTDEIQTEITNSLGRVDERLEALKTRRAELEETAQALLTRINDASFYAVDDLTGLQTEFDTTQDEIDLYNAQQALDELADAESRLNSERQRLERDAEAVAARELQGKKDILSVMGPNGVAEFQDYAQIDPEGARAYARRLANTEEEEEQLLALIPTAFSQNVIRV